MARRDLLPHPTGLVHAFLYRRISGAEHQQEGLSLDTQQTTLRQYVAGQTGWLIAGEFTDVMSGKRADRPAYQAMLTEVRHLSAAGARVAIVVARLDRLARNKAEYFRAAEELAQQGAEVHSVKDGGVLNETHASILAVFAADEAKRIGERVAENRARVVQDGWHYGRVAFGYRLRPATDAERKAGSPQNVLEPDPELREVATELFQRIAGGESVRKVTAWLASLPEPLRGGRNWHHSSMSKTLRSPTYVARNTEGPDDVLTRPMARWEPLVDDDTWRKVQARLDSHHQQPHQGGRSLLAGFLRCHQCGWRMGATSNTRLGRTYRCEARNGGVTAPRCYRHVPVHRADQAVLDAVGAVLTPLNDPEQWPTLQRAWAAREKPSGNRGRRVASLEATKKQAQRRLADAARMLVDGRLDGDGYAALRDAEKTAIEQAEAELERVRTQHPQSGKLPSLAEALSLTGGWATALREGDLTAQRDILNALVEQVTVQYTGWREYTADVTWTPLGDALRQVSEGAG